MIIPSPKPSKFSYEIKEILDLLYISINTQEIKYKFPRLHVNNEFNKRFSGVLDAFDDIEVSVKRLTKNIQESITTNSEIQRNTLVTPDVHERAIQAANENKTDLKTIHVQAKIFLDRYNALVLFILGWTIPESCYKSIGEFNKWLADYGGSEDSVLRYKKSCERALDDIYVYITKFRNNSVVHRNEDIALGKTEWFENDMLGSVRLVGGNHNSVSPQEVLFLTVEYIDLTTKFCLNKISPKN